VSERRRKPISSTTTQTIAHVQSLPTQYRRIACEYKWKLRFS